MTRLATPVALAVIVGCVSPAGASTIAVAAGGDLQRAIGAAQPGDTILLASGAVFTGNFSLPKKDGTGVITLRTAPNDRLPPDGVRVTPDSSRGFATLRSPNAAPVLQTAPGAHHWRIALVELTGAGPANLIELGDGSAGQRSLDAVPHDLAVDQSYMHGDASTGIRRCVALNSASTAITNSYISDCKWIGEDAQAIAGWNGPGPFRIENNYLEGSGENILFGGADPSIPDLVPSDITIAGNLIAKPTEWRGARWQVKNLLELKNARRVSIDGNTLEYNWPGAQSGFAVLFTVRNQDGRCPWCQVEQVSFTNNMLRHSAAGVEILGFDDQAASRQTRDITIRNNVLADIDSEHWGGNGYAFLLLGGPQRIVIDHNTIIQEHAYGILQAEGPPILQFTFTNNVALHNAYGMIGASHAPGNDTLSAFCPQSIVRSNVIATGDPSRYPTGNRFPSAAEFRRQFVAYDSGDYRLIATSAWRNAGTDGRDLGASLASADPGRLGRPIQTVK